MGTNPRRRPPPHRAEAHFELFEIVPVLGPDRPLWLYLDWHATSEPIDSATVQVNLLKLYKETAKTKGDTHQNIASICLKTAQGHSQKNS